MSLPLVVAHQSGDGVQICHCPFCGSGQVIGRSDGNTECSFCNQSFLVRVQPMFSAFPQSIDGMPVDIPGMPPASGMPGMPPGGDPAAGGEGPPGQEDGGGGAPPFGDDSPSEDSGGDESQEDSPDDSGGDSGGPPFGKKESYRTASGQKLARASYVDYLAGQLGAGR